MTSPRVESRRSFEGLIAAGLLLLVAAGGLWAFTTETPPQRRRFVVVVVDASRSGPQDVRCRDAERIARRELDRSSQLKLLLLSTTTSTHANEPTHVGTFSFSPGHGVLEGKGKAERKRVEFVKSVHQACTNLPRTYESPIFSAVRTAVDYMRNLGCADAYTDCEAFVLSDGIETSDATVRRALI